MSDLRTSITVYSDVMTLDEFESLLGPDWMSEDVFEREHGLVDPANPLAAELGIDQGPRRYLFWQGSHGGWLDEEAKIEELIEMRADVVEIGWEQQDQAAQYSEVISAQVWTREGVTKFTTALVPETYPAMIATIRNARRQGNEHAAWLAVEHLLVGLEKGAAL